MPCGLPATAANATGAVVGIIVDDDDDWFDEAMPALVIEDIEDIDVVTVVDADDSIAAIPDAVSWTAFVDTDDTFSEGWFLLGVEHTIVLFCASDIVVLFDDNVEFRSDLFARTAVGFTG